VVSDFWTLLYISKQVGFGLSVYEFVLGLDTDSTWT